MKRYFALLVMLLAVGLASNISGLGARAWAQDAEPVVRDVEIKFIGGLETVNRTLIKANIQTDLGYLRGEALIPVIRHDGVGQPDYILAVDLIGLQPATANERAVRFAVEDPQAETMLLPVLDVLLDLLPGRLFRKGLAVCGERLHDLGI